MTTQSMSSALNVPRRILHNLRRTRTQNITKLFATRLKLVRVEFVGHDHPALSRVSTFLAYGPLLIIGYGFTLASVVLLLAPGIGWAAALFLIGAIHMALGAWGVRRGRLLSAAADDDVVDFECEQRGATSEIAPRDRAQTSVRLPQP